jgi:hypothetical protein
MFSDGVRCELCAGWYVGPSEQLTPERTLWLRLKNGAKTPRGRRLPPGADGRSTNKQKTKLSASRGVYTNESSQ